MQLQALETETQNLQEGHMRVKQYLHVLMEMVSLEQSSQVAHNEGNSLSGQPVCSGAVPFFLAHTFALCDAHLPPEPRMVFDMRLRIHRIGVFCSRCCAARVLANSLPFRASALMCTITQTSCLVQRGSGTHTFSGS